MDKVEPVKARNLWEEIDFRVIDQRIGMGVGGHDTVIRAYHKPTGIIVEMPKISRSQFHDRQIAIEMIEAALTSPNYRPEK